MKAKTFIATLLLAMYFFSLTSFAENESSRNGIYDYSWKGIANSKFISNQLILGLINLTEQIENSKQLRFGDVVRLNIDSPGGFLLSADNLTEYFRSFENAVFAKTGNNLIVRVKNKCESACVVVAAKIYSNTINSALSHTDFKVCKSAKFGFHAPFSVINGKQVTNDYLFLLYRGTATIRAKTCNRSCAA